MIVWGEPKRRANLDKHGLDFASLPSDFFETATIISCAGGQADRARKDWRSGSRPGGVSPPRLGSGVRHFHAAGQLEGKEASMTTGRKMLKVFTPGRGYSKADWGDVDSPELTDEQIAQARPFAEVFPQLAENLRRSHGGRPPADKPKKAISIRLDQEVIEKFKATGPGWQSRMNDVLKRAKLKA
jgi:uncharacterized protein (DUF4415 family)